MVPPASHPGSAGLAGRARPRLAAGTRAPERESELEPPPPPPGPVSRMLPEAAVRASGATGMASARAI